MEPLLTERTAFDLVKRELFGHRVVVEDERARSLFMLTVRSLREEVHLEPPLAIGPIWAHVLGRRVP